MVTGLESLIDRFDEELPELTAFIIPGGSAASSALHLARTTCRRSERLAVRLSQSEAIGQSVVAYLNRLSDLLFVLARTVNRQAGVPESTWQGS